jgi:hypothetical protein
MTLMLLVPYFVLFMLSIILTLLTFLVLLTLHYWILLSLLKDLKTFRTMLGQGKNIEDYIALYFHEDDETRLFYSPYWDINKTLEMLSQHLFYLKDFSKDIRIFGSYIFLEGARRVAAAVDTRIPVTELSITSAAQGALLPTHELYVFVTFRQARAEAFFNRYYGQIRDE